MFWIVFKSLAILYLTKLLDILMSLLSVWSHHRLHQRLGGDSGGRGGRRGAGDEDCPGGGYSGDVEAPHDGDFV